MTDKIIIPMIVLAHHYKNSIQVPAINPNYQTALSSYLGKNSTPRAFKTDILLKKGIHLHFILPSALKKGREIEKNNGEKTFEYPAVPDRFIVTRMYEKNGKIETKCNIVESNFYSLDEAYSESITIPKFDDLRARHRFRYMGRTYPASAPIPVPLGESAYFEKITALGAGDPLFSAYYPSCSSVFGFYDNLEDVPPNAVLSYFVIGYYSNPANDIFHTVKNLKEMKERLLEYDLSIDDEQKICNSCAVFGEVSGIDLSKSYPPPLGEIHVGIGKSSSEALSAIIKGVYYKNNPEIERFLTSLQYDTADEAKQLDGNFKIDDDIHFRGFSQIDPIEQSCLLRLPKDFQKRKAACLASVADLAKSYSDVMSLEHEAAKLRRSLEYKKNSLYYLWEIYEDASSAKKGQIKPYLDDLIKKIALLRNNIYAKMNEAKQKGEVFKKMLNNNGEFALQSSDPFCFPKDPALVLFGSGMNRTYAFGEDGRFEADNSLFCITKPLSSDISADKLLAYFNDVSFSQNTCENYTEYLLSALLLDAPNILAKLKIKPVIKEKYSPIMFNDKPDEQVTLLMQWQSAFYPNYDDSNPIDSTFEYGNTDYQYDGSISERKMVCDGITVLTPHGVYNLQDKLKKYLEYHLDSPEAEALTNKIKDLAAVSQSLSGFTINLAALSYAFQFPIDINPKDDFSKSVAECINPKNSLFYEAPAERLAVRNNSPIFPLREGFFGLSKLALTTTFGESRKLIDDDLSFKGVKYFSENLLPVKNDHCFFPLALSSAAKLSAHFVTAFNNKIISSPLPGATPIIGIFLPDMLNRNLNIFSNAGESIGFIKTSYRIVQGKKRPVGRFIQSPAAPAKIDSRIINFIAELTKENSAFEELMAIIDIKLNATLPLAQNNFIFGRALVLSEISVELEYFGSPEWSKKDDDIGKFDNAGLFEQKFPILFGDKNRATDGFCCGFYNGFSKGFAAFGAEQKNAEYLNAETFSLSSKDGAKNLTLLFDPMLKVTLSTGILPAKQIEIYGEHTDFSSFQLLSAELNMLISEEEHAQLPDFSGGADFKRFYPKRNDKDLTYEKLAIKKPSAEVGSIGKTIITDGTIVETKELS